MKSAKVAVVLLLMASTLCPAEKKSKKPDVPAVIGQARFVYVEAMDGGEFDRDLSPADRIAVADVRDALKAWGRYTIISERDKAELIFVVRKGRLGEADADAGMSAQNPRFPSVGQAPMGQPGMQNQNRQQQRDDGTGVGGGVGPGDDLLQVCPYNVNNGKRGSPLWLRSEANGLNGPRVRLLAQFRDAVEKAYPAPLTTNSQGNGSTNGQTGSPSKP